jgi:RNA recognition motif-containing protein
MSLSGREELGRCCLVMALQVNEREPVNNIFVGNLHPNVTEHDIRPLFEKHGEVRRFKMMTDRWTGLSRGFGFIQMKTDREAEVAIVALNGTNLNGKVLKVNPARPQLHRTVRGKSKG